MIQVGDKVRCKRDGRIQQLWPEHIAEMFFAGPFEIVETKTVHPQAEREPFTYVTARYTPEMQQAIAVYFNDSYPPDSPARWEPADVRTFFCRADSLEKVEPCTT
jgi:hypothetical protein